MSPGKNSFRPMQAKLARARGQRFEDRLDQAFSRLVNAEPYSRETGLLLWPRPTTGAPLCGGTHNFQQMRALRDAGIITEEERKNLTQGNGGRSNPALMEWLMGFLIGWTELDAWETR